MQYDGHCPNCSCNEMRVELLEQGIHYAKAVCVFCGTFLKFMPKPKNLEARKGSTLNLAKKYDIKYCELCLRYQDELPQGQTLHGHHVVEHQDGGNDDRSNIWGLCTHCHELVALIRRRVGHNHLERREGVA